MSVPNTSTFSLQDVVDEVGPTTNDLVDCIADANSADYDPAYYTSPATSLLEFRNYAGPLQISIVSSGTSTTSGTSITHQLGYIDVGNMVVVTVFQDSPTSIITTPSGYTVERSTLDGIHVFSKVNLNPTSQSVTITSSQSGYKIVNVMDIANQSAWGADTAFATTASSYSPSLTGLTNASLVFMAWHTTDTVGTSPNPTLTMESGTGSSSVIAGYPGSGSFRAWISYYFQPSTTTSDRFATLTQGTNDESAGVLFEIKT